MRLSFESPRARWTALGAVWVVAGICMALHVAAIDAHLSIVGARGLRGARAPQTTLSHAYLPGSLDTQLWVEHARDLLKGTERRLRHTDLDNAPFGREVHWNSAWAWLIAGAASADRAITGADVGTALERTTIWLQPALLFLLIVITSAYAARRAGAIAGVVVAAAMLGHDYFYSGFYPNNVDHHGVLSATVFGMVLAMCFAGAGWISRDDTAATNLLPTSAEYARRDAMISGVCGAIGLWISAASVVLPIALVGVCGLLAALSGDRSGGNTHVSFDASVWRAWGKAGAIASIVFYFVEYFPTHLGFRLEVNHPLYAAAWWGGAELVALAGEWRVRSTQEILTSRVPLRFALACIALAMAPAIIVIAGSRVFTLSDPVMSRLHFMYITEFKPLWTGLAGLSWNPWGSVIGIENAPLIAGAGVLIARRGRLSPLFWFIVAATFAMTVVQWLQMRWMQANSGLQIVLALVLLGHFLGHRMGRARWTAALLVVTAMFLPSTVRRISEARETVQTRFVDPKEDLSMLYRDIASTIRAQVPSGDVILLAGPNASPAIGYYGGFRAIGTLYWENAPGLKAASAIFAAKSDDSAATLIRARHVTHIAMISDVDFADAYPKLLNPNATEADIEQSFAYRLLNGRVLPIWLQMIPYVPPDDLAGLNIRVRLFTVAFEGTPDDALYHQALGAVAEGNLDEAGQDFEMLLQHDPQAHRLWIGKSGVLFAKRDYAGAADAAMIGIARAPSTDRVRLTAWIADSFLRERQTEQAIRVYRHALQTEFNPDLACALAFTLSTTIEESLLRGSEAVMWGQRALATKPDSPIYLNCLAAAYAEVGRFPDAVAAANKALENATAQQDSNAFRIAEQLVARFRTGKPWRN